jgi:uncharacterized protein YndB with AHSA1/START domain
MKRDLRLERTYPHAPEHVWRALTDPRALAKWLMPNDFEARVGHAFTFRTRPQPGFDGIVYCEVTELDPPRRLAYTWRGGPGDGKLTLDTRLRFTLEPVDGGTRLVLEHTGFEGMRAVAVSFIMGAGWAKMMRGRLPALLDELRS